MQPSAAQATQPPCSSLSRTSGLGLAEELELSLGKLKLSFIPLSLSASPCYPLEEFTLSVLLFCLPLPPLCPFLPQFPSYNYLKLGEGPEDELHLTHMVVQAHAASFWAHHP